MREDNDHLRSHWPRGPQPLGHPKRPSTFFSSLAQQTQLSQHKDLILTLSSTHSHGMSHRNTADPALKPISNVPRRVTIEHTPTSSRTSSVTPVPQPSPRSETIAQSRDDFSDWDSEEDDMTNSQPTLQRPNDGLSHQPLLHHGDNDEGDRGRTGYSEDLEGREDRPTFSRRSTMRSRSPHTQAKMAARKKYTYAAFFLALSLVSFTIQTETAVYIQHELHWNKAYCMLYLTHGSWTLLWPFQLLVLRLQKWTMPWPTFWRRHIHLVRTTAQMVEKQSLDVPKHQHSPVPYFIRITAFVTCALTIAGGSWYVAVDLTSPSDLTAIYNCSAFFAYAFSVPLLREKLRFDKSFAVLVAIVGVLVVAYGDATPTKHGGKSGGAVGGGPPQDDKETKEAKSRLVGNLIIGVGSVLYGLYEVLYKRLACPPDGVSPGRGMIFAMTFGSLIGTFTLTVLWIPLPILHYFGWEIFELPRGEAAWMLGISVLCNAIFSGSFLTLISLTSPVLSSVAALLTIFLVAIVDWLITGTPLTAAAIVGGILIIGAFGLLAWSTYREMMEDKRRLEIDIEEDDDEDD